jgi:hypothetical protein
MSPLWIGTSMISHNPLDAYPTFKQGNSYKLDVQVLDGKTRLPVNLVDLGDARYALLDTNKSGVAQLTKTLGAGIEVVNGLLGLIQVTLEAEDTQTLNAGRNYHELVIKTVVGTVHTVIDELLYVEEQAIVNFDPVIPN